MKVFRQMERMKRIVLAAAGMLFATWLVMNFRFLTAEQSGLVRFCLTIAFSMAIIFRPKPEKHKHEPKTPLFYIALGITGTLLSITGLVFNVHQVEWLGLIIILFTCLAWALPDSYRKDIFLGFFLIYWVHPLPASIFGGLQLAAQQISVTGSEWLLHAFNVRVWSDGFVLRTGLNTFEVPEWCSGMRTATTVFIVATGLGILKRFKWQECAVIVFITLIQAIGLNILRISIMITIAPTTGSWAGMDFLHNTAGIIVISAIFLTYLEIEYWKNRKRKRPDTMETDISEGHLLLGLPPFWSWLREHKIPVAVSILLIIAIPAGIYKNRPFHKAAMIKDVASILRDTGSLELAQKAAEVAMNLTPYDEDWKMTIIRLLIIRQKHDEALAALDRLPQTDPYLSIEIQILKAYSLMALHKMPEAMALVRSMPASVVNSDPRVAMILAEMAFNARKADDVAKHVVTAAGWHPNINRIRALYPFLRAYRKWKAIAESDIRIPYGDASQCLSAIEAYMNLNNIPVVASMIQEALVSWPEDARILEPLFFMTIKRTDGKWEERFTIHFLKCTAELNDPDSMSLYFNKCFQLGRPDLAWKLYSRIAAIDPRHPALPSCAATHGDAWFSFRKRFLGINTPFDEETMDLKPLALIASSFRSWRSVIDRIPLAMELAKEDTVTARKSFLGKALKEFESRDAAKKLTLQMQYEYAGALEKSGAKTRALEIIDRISRTYPETKTRNVSITSEIYQRTGDWQNVYETLRDMPWDDNPNLLSLLRLCQAQLELKLNLGALETARLLMQKYPESNDSLGALVMTLLELDLTEEALFALGRPRIRRDRQLNMMEAELLFRTQRYREAEEYCRSIFIPSIRTPPETTQHFVLPPAEISITWHNSSLPDEKDFAKNAEALNQMLPVTRSPFLKKMNKLWRDCYTSRCAAGSADISKWMESGRNDSEKAIALNHLTLLLCRDNRFAEARNAAGKAVKLMPGSPILWRILIGLSGADIEVIDAARHSCPDDPEIWLAELVAKTSARKPANSSQVMESLSWTEEDVLKNFGTNGKTRQSYNRLSIYDPATVARAGDYLMRKGYHGPAIIALKNAVGRARGLLPIYIMGMKYAMVTRDNIWATQCNTAALNVSLRPPADFYRQMISTKSSSNSITVDSETLEALKAMRREEPDNPLWAQMLGYVRFRRGGWETAEALNEMRAAIEAGATNKTPFVVAAESARQLGNFEGAVELLRKGMEHHPGNLEMLNNLVYTLALSPPYRSPDATNTLSPQDEALQLLPLLLAHAGNNLHILDTVSVAYLRAGKLENAGKAINNILQESKTGSHLWFRAQMHAAEIAFRQNNREEARAILTGIMKYSRGIPDEDILASRKLMEQIAPPASSSMGNAPASPSKK